MKDVLFYLTGWVIFFGLPAGLALVIFRERPRRWKLFGFFGCILTGWFGLVFVFIAQHAPHNLFGPPKE